jgi:arylsulfatase A-like enzyme
MLHHKAPHEAHDPAPRHKDLFANDVIPEPATLLDDYKGRAPEKIQDELIFSRMSICHYTYYQDAVNRFGTDRKKTTRYMYQVYMKGYLRLVASLDENVGRMLDYLDQSGLADNTLVVYTSDNGFFNGEHGFFNKMWMYEESLRIPMLAQYPGVIKPGAENNHMVSMIDLAPTFLNLAGAKIPDDMQGQSILPLLRGENPRWRDAVYYHYYAQFKTPEQYGVRTQRYKLIRYPTLQKGPEWELFDLQNDPTELNNLADDPKSKSVVNELRKKLDQLRREFKEPKATP